MTIVKENYIAGAYTRKHTKGYFQYLRYNYGTVKVDRAKGNEIVIDYAIDDVNKKNSINEGLYQLYYKKLRHYFRDFTRLEAYTDEEIYGDIHIIRKEIFGHKMKEIFIIDTYEEGLTAKRRTDALGFEENILNVIYGNIEPSRRSKSSPINQIKLLKETINKKHQLIFLVGDRGQLYHLLRMLDNDLLEFRDKHIILYLKNEKIYDEATIDDYKDIVTNYSMDGLNGSKKLNNIEIRSYDHPAVGFDFRKLKGRDCDLFKEACSSKAVVIGLGETHIFSLKNVDFDYFILSPIQRIVVSRYTNIYSNGSNTIPYMIGYVLKEFTCEQDFTGNERLCMSVYHYNSLLNNNGIDTCRHQLTSTQNVSSIYHNLYMNFYSTTINEKDFPELLIEDYCNKNDYTEKKRKRLHAFINNHFNGNYISCYYNADNLYRIMEKDHGNHNNQVLVTGLIFNGPITMKAIESDNISKSIISPRELAKNEKDNGLSFYSNFLYFVTNNIKEGYNCTRKLRPMEKIAIDNIFLGYKYLNSNPYTREEYFPLYNKGFMGVKKSGDVIFGRRTLLGGKMMINNEVISWERDNINTTHGAVSIFTPYKDNHNLSSYSDNFRNFCYLCGNERLNLVIINNKIVCVRYGQVAIPSIGVVVSVDDDYIDGFKTTLGLKAVTDGYYEITKSYTLELFLEKPDSLSHNDWNNVKWVYGGATLLVEDGINLVENREKQMEAFRNEGWFHPLSMQTQETQVQDWVRGPRTVVGLTDNNKFFVCVFSGRTKESCGVNFNELVTILEKEIGGISWAMNLDGGASSCLSVVYKNELFELSYPCVSDLSSAGMVRPINSILMMK